MSTPSDPSEAAPTTRARTPDPAAENPRSLKPFILVLAAVVVLGAAIAIVYKLQEPAPQSMSFRVDDAPRGTFNATVLNSTGLRTEKLLMAHLDTAVQAGQSVEDVDLRVDELRRALKEATREAGPTWYVVWKEHVIVITASGG